MRTDRTSCPACRCGRFARWFAKSTPAGEYPVWRCGGCRSAFVFPRPSVAEIEAFYGRHAYRAQDGETPAERFRRLMEREKAYPNSTLDASHMVESCKRFARGARFLDVGAGYGFFSNAAVARGFQVQAIEPARSCREVFSLLNGFEPEPGLLDKSFVEKNRHAFDVVLMSQVLEHVLDLDETVRFLTELLTDDGVVAIAVPHFRSLISRLQGRRDMFITPPEHLNFFTTRGLRSLFERHGLEVLSWATISRFDPGRIRRKLPLGPLSNLGGAALKAVLKAADVARLGLYANGYFRRITAT